ncbi:MAG: hypothetical protein WB622_03140 [Acidobacteriaceae bacterium]
MAVGWMVVGWAAACSAQNATTVNPADQQPQPLQQPRGLAPDASQAAASEAGAYREMDLLRRDGFAGAKSASVMVRVLDRKGATAEGLEASDFELTVNGTRRSFRLQAPGVGTTRVPAVVLLVFPPNQPLVHHLGAQQAIRYFSQLPQEPLPWKVGTFDANRKFTPFTDSREELLATLKGIDEAREPIELTQMGLPRGEHWAGGWLVQADEAIGVMERYPGPKVVLAMNPAADWSFGGNDPMIAQDGPETLTGAAAQVGTHIYVDNASGPTVVIPGGDASALSSMAGVKPSETLHLDAAQDAALASYAYRTSQMMQSAADTQGGFANSLKDLAGQIHRNLDGNYLLDFDLTAKDQDIGFPAVGVKVARRDLRVTIEDVIPIGLERDAVAVGKAQKMAELLVAATAAHVSSPDFRIFQRVDSFPLRGGTDPDLPLSGAVEWIGQGPAPEGLHVIVAVEDATFSRLVLERALAAEWSAGQIAWEHDGQLSPGAYIWRVGLVDGADRVVAASERPFSVPFPRENDFAASSLVVGPGCEGGAATSGLQRRRKEPPGGDNGMAPRTIDPMRAQNCRVHLDATQRFRTMDTLRAFVRIYPAGRLEKRPPEDWTAQYAVRSMGGAVEKQSDLRFTLDSGSGYLALVQWPLDGASIGPGEHTLEVVIRGPGIHGDLRLTRRFVVDAR